MKLSVVQEEEEEEDDEEEEEVDLVVVLLAPIAFHLDLYSILQESAEDTHLARLSLQTDFSKSDRNEFSVIELLIA